MVKPLSPARRRLVEKYVHLTHVISNPYAEKWPSDVDEYVSAAQTAMVEAAALDFDGVDHFVMLAGALMSAALKATRAEIRLRAEFEVQLSVTDLGTAEPTTAD